MINNIELIKQLINFEKPGDFYMLYVFKRKKDQPEGERDNHQSVRTIKTYCIESIEHLERRYDEIKQLVRDFIVRSTLEQRTILDGIVYDRSMSYARPSDSYWGAHASSSRSHPYSMRRGGRRTIKHKKGRKLYKKTYKKHKTLKIKKKTIKRFYTFSHFKRR